MRRDAKRERERLSPFEFIDKLTVSMTSTNASFLRYLTSFLLHEIAPVAWIVILEASSLFCFSQARRRVPIIESVVLERLIAGEGCGARKEWMDSGRTTACSDLTPSVVMYIFSVSDSEF